jgi:hypothetical protein
MDYYAGIDVSLEWSSVCIVDGTGTIIAEAKVMSEAEALIGWLRAQPFTLSRIGLEAGPLSQWLFAGLEADGLAAELRAGPRKAKVALARKLAVILHRMLADGTTFEARRAVYGNRARRQLSRADQVDEHHGQLAAFGLDRTCRGGAWLCGCEGGAAALKYGDGVEQLAAVPDRSHAHGDQILGGQPRQHLVADRVGAESLDIILQAQDRRVQRMLCERYRGSGRRVARRPVKMSANG